jgi:hypothetical protein
MAIPCTPAPSSSTSPETSKPGLKGGCGCCLILAAGDQAVGKIDPTGADPDPHLAGTGARFGNVVQAQRSGPVSSWQTMACMAGNPLIVEEEKPFSVAQDEKGVLTTPLRAHSAKGGKTRASGWVNSSKRNSLADDLAHDVGHGDDADRPIVLGDHQAMHATAGHQADRVAQQHVRIAGCAAGGHDLPASIDRA